MTDHFPFVKKAVEKIADGGPNIPQWNLVDFGDKDAIHQKSTTDVNEFKTAIQALAIRGMYSIFKISHVYEQIWKIHFMKKIEKYTAQWWEGMGGKENVTITQS